MIVKLSALKTLQTRSLFSVDSVQQSLGENDREFHSFFTAFTLMVSLSDSMVHLSSVYTALVMLKHGHLTFDLLLFPKLNRYTKGLPAKSLLNLVYIWLTKTSWVFTKGRIFIIFGYWTPYIVVCGSNLLCSRHPWDFIRSTFLTCLWIIPIPLRWVLYLLFLSMTWMICFWRLQTALLCQTESSMIWRCNSIFCLTKLSCHSFLHFSRMTW